MNPELEVGQIVFTTSYRVERADLVRLEASPDPRQLAVAGPQEHRL